MSSHTKATPSTIGARRRLKLLTFVMVLFLSWAAYILANQYGQMSGRQAELRETSKKLSEAEAKNEALKQETLRLKQDEYVGQIARRDLGMGLPGEQPIQIQK
ncbi:FtsB family cell division protein [Cohnella candidum]|nr:septum formation initiator family protein [Cohnella candidum]